MEMKGHGSGVIQGPIERHIVFYGLLKRTVYDVSGDKAFLSLAAGELHWDLDMTVIQASMLGYGGLYLQGKTYIFAIKTMFIEASGHFLKDLVSLVFIDGSRT